MAELDIEVVARDNDGDGFEAVAYGGTDCDDADAAVNPDAEETWYGGTDADCDGASDYDGDGFDSDGYGGADCDDDDDAVSPDADEVWYDGADADCDGASDYDADGFDSDGHGDDCDDADAAVNPDAEETWYDGSDADCDGASDYDVDGDGFDSDGYGGGDCDDDDAVNPDADEVCDDEDTDEDCDGLADDDDPDALYGEEGYADVDGDGFGDPDAPLTSCEADGLSADDTDCDDTDPDVNPDAEETWYDGSDADCDGASDYDVDGDGFDSDGYGGGDSDEDDDNADADPGDPADDPCVGLRRELCWVRTNGVVVSGLIPSMGAPTSDAVTTYLDDFGANTVHLWSSGLPEEVEGWRSYLGSDLRFISWVQDDGTSTKNNEVLGGVGAGADGLVGYQVGDEPDDLEELYAIAEGVDAVRAVDPDANIIVNFSVGKEEIEEMFDYFAEDMGGGIFSYDYYSYGYAEYEALGSVRSAALRHGLPYWRYLRSYEDTGSSNWPEESDLRWIAYSGLTYGYTGHHWFVYQISSIHAVVSAFFSSPDTWSGTTEHFEMAAELNRELVNVGEVITQLTSTDVRFIPASTLYMPDDHQNWSRGAGGDPYLKGVEAVGLQFWEFQDLIVGFFQDDDGEHYIMVQNGNHESADWPLWTHDRVDVELSFDFSNAPGSVDTSVMEVLDASTGDVREVGLSGGVMELELLAGEGVLMKYATGADWARR